MAEKNYTISFLIKGIQDSTFYKALQSGSSAMQAFSQHTNQVFTSEFSSLAEKYPEIIGGVTTTAVAFKNPILAIMFPILQIEQKIFSFQKPFYIKL